jgi:DNA relaxase NicK
VKNADNGETVYIGDRASDIYGRLYDKQAECEEAGESEEAEHYSSCWRYELELKGPTAERLVDELPVDAERPQWIARLMRDYWQAHGVIVAFDAEAGPQLRLGFRRRSDATSKMRWLRRSVMPSIEWLANNGRRDELQRMLSEVINYGAGGDAES